MISGLLFLVSANAAALLGSRVLLTRLRTGKPSLDAVLFLLVRLLLISAFVLASGLFGTLSPLGVGIPSIIALIGLLLLGAHRGLSVPRLPPVGSAAAALAAVVLARLLLQTWFFSPHLGDPLAYHLPKIAEWIRAGRFTHEMGVHSHVTFPAGFELIETWWVVFLRHDVLIEAAGIEFVVLAFASVFALAEGLGLSARAAFFGGLATVLVPGIHLSATSCLNDVPPAALLMATMALVAARVHPALMLMTMAMGIGIKPTYGFALPGVVLLWVLTRREHRTPTPAPTTAWILASVAMSVGAYWYVRNLLWFGNPFYPLGSPGYEDPTPVQFGPKWASLVVNLSNLINVRIYDSSAVYGANVDDMTGWGSVAFGCGGMALLVLGRSDFRLRRLAWAFGVSLLAVLTLIQNDPWCLKYVFFFPAILCLASAAAMDRWPSMAPIGWLSLLFCFAGTFFSYDLRLPQARQLAIQPWRVRTAAVFPYGEIGSDVPVDAIGYFGSPTGAAYLLYRPDYSRRVAYLRSTSPANLIDDMKQAGVEVLIAPSPSQVQAGILEECCRRGQLRAAQDRFYRRSGAP